MGVFLLGVLQTPSNSIQPKLNQTSSPALIRPTLNACHMHKGRLHCHSLRVTFLDSSPSNSHLLPNPPPPPRHSPTHTPPHTILSYSSLLFSFIDLLSLYLDIFGIFICLIHHPTKLWALGTCTLITSSRQVASNPESFVKKTVF